MNKVFICAKIK